MVLIILLVLALFVLQTFLPGLFRQSPGPGDSTLIPEILGNRDHVRPLSVVGQRAARALGNLQEALPVFLALALLNLIVGTAAAMALTGAWIFLAARVVYLPVYMGGIPVLRTLVWTGGWVGLVMMLIPLLDRI
jgi:uncharacterized MAPEG superfamily protein